MASQVTLALAQVDLAVGDVVGNAAKIITHANRARDELQADLVVFPELSVCGYPPEDLLFHSGLRENIEDAISNIRESVRGIAILVGFPEYADDVIYNTSAVFRDGE
ncbi:MAG: NAD+ synthase, partial [Proteobacteria bacterium]|nr:NAD+ synthase [Pseudomonadota bacterium]